MTASQHPGEGRETDWDELRREIEALPQIDSVRLDSVAMRREIEPSTLLVRAAVLAIVDRLAAARGEPGLDVERLAMAIADHDDICSRMAIPECADKIAAEYDRLGSR